MASVATLWSTTTDFSAAVSEFPVVFDSTVGVTIADMYGLNGTYVNFDNTQSTAFTVADGKLAISDTSGITTNMYVFVSESSVGANVDGYWKVVSIDTNVSITLGTTLAASTGMDSDDTVSYYIGGIGDASDGSNLQLLLNDIGPDCGAGPGDATNNLDILYHASVAITLTGTVNIDAISGSLGLRASLIGVDADFVNDGTQVEINTSASLVNGLFNGAASIIGINIENFDFNLSGTGKADYGIKASDALTDYWALINCKFRNGPDVATAGISIGGDFWRLVGCEFTGCYNGFFAENNDAQSSTITNCTFISNVNHGLVLENGIGSVFSCIFDSNGGSGLICLGSSSGGVYMGINNNTFINNTGNNFDIVAHVTGWTITNNTSLDSSGLGYNFNSTTTMLTHLFRNNHAYNNSQPSDAAATDGEFLILGNGNNVVGDPDLTNYIPSSSSPLIDAGVGGTGDTIGALCATAGGGAGGGLNRLSGLLG